MACPSVRWRVFVCERWRLTVYVDPWGDQLPRAYVTVHEQTRTAKVTYRGPDGRKFSVMVHQKPNPIGFHAKLPGDRVRSKD